MVWICVSVFGFVHVYKPSAVVFAVVLHCEDCIPFDLMRFTPHFKDVFFLALFFNFGIYSMFNCHAQHITNFYINLLDYQKSATCSPVFVTFPCNIVCVCVCVWECLFFVFNCVISLLCSGVYVFSICFFLLYSAQIV